MSRKRLNMTSLGITPADELLRSRREQKSGGDSDGDARPKTPIAQATRRVVEYREDALDKAEKENERLRQELDDALAAVSPDTKRAGVRTVDPARCRVWAYADRPDEEADHADELAESFRVEGQIQPAVVRPVNDDPNIEYEVVAGHVRWRAAKKAGLPLQVVVRELDDQGAFRVMIAENEQRRDLSDRAKAMRFKHAAETGLYASKRELAKSANIEPPTLQYYLGYAELPDEAFAHVEDICSISARWGYDLAAAHKQGASLDAIQAAIVRIEKKQLKRQDLAAFLRSFDQTSSTESPEHADTSTANSLPSPQRAAVRFRSHTGQHLFSLKQYKGKGPMLAFPSVLADAVSEDFLEEVRDLFERRLGQRAIDGTESGEGGARDN